MTWWTTHVRPRDVFVAFAASSLAALAVVVWIAAPAVSDQARAGALGGIVTTFGTLLGYYLGNRGAESALEAATSERDRVARLETELAETRVVAARAEDAVEAATLALESADEE